MRKNTWRAVSLLGVGFVALGCKGATTVRTGTAPAIQPWTEFTVTMLDEDAEHVPNVYNPIDPDEGLASAENITGESQIHKLRTDGAGDAVCLTCGDGTEATGQNFQAQYTPDGAHIVFASSRAQPVDTNPLLQSFGGDIFIMDRDGANPQRLSFLDGFARVPCMSRDGTTVHWTQVTSDGRWHLLYAPLLEDAATFSLGPISEVQVIADEEHGEAAGFSRALAWAEWVSPAPVGDWWTVGATYGGSMNVDTFAISPSAGEVRRLTSSAENEERSSWDPSGLGLVVPSGRAREQARQLFPFPTQPFTDYALVFYGLLFAQVGRAVPWGTDIYYMDSRGEPGMQLLVNGVDEGFLSGPSPQSGPLGRTRQPFGMWRGGLANTDPSRIDRRFGYIEFAGKPDGVFADGDRPAFLAAATIETYPARAVAFDPEALHPSAHATLAGRAGGEVEVELSHHIDAHAMNGSASVTYRGFQDGDYRVDGNCTMTYNLASLLDMQFQVDLDLTFVDRGGIEYHWQTDWGLEGLVMAATVTIEQPGNTSVRTLRLDPTALLSP